MTVPVSVFTPELCRRLSTVMLALIVVASVYFEKSRLGRSTSASPVFSVPTGSRNTISIRGDVRHPGIYNISDNLLTEGAIKMAIPVASIASWYPIGIEAAPPVHGAEIFIGMESSGKAVLHVKTLSASQLMLLGLHLDINEMNLDDFIDLPGIGPALAERIIDFRQKNGDFMRVSDLLSIQGIGEKKYKQLSKYF